MKTRPDNSHLRWLHLCDLHLGARDEAQTLAMAQLIDAITTHTSSNNIDLVILAGDLAYSGRAQEYLRFTIDVVAPLRQIQSLRNAKFLSVPGNHDLDCDISYPLAWNSLGTRRQTIFWNSDEPARQLRRHRARGFQEYSNFLQNTDINGPNPLVEIGSTFEINHVRFICLNTALFSDRDLTEKDERGKSPLPVQTFRQLAEQATDRTPLVVVGHHPINWFEPQSASHFQAALSDYHTFYIHGHEHRVEVSFGSSALRSLGFGASYPARLDSKSKQPYTSTFAICELAEHLHVKFVSWDSNNGVWRPFHNLPHDIRRESEILLGGYAIPIPTTRSTLLSPRFRLRSEDIKAKFSVKPPIWVDGAPVTTWADLLQKIGLVAKPDSITGEDPNPVPSNSRFFIRDARGNHLVYATRAETAVITYEQVEKANTQLDTLQLSSCILATFGKVTQGARTLADNLRRSKNLVLLDGVAISEKLRDAGALDHCIEEFSEFLQNVAITPLVLPNGLAMMVTDAVQHRWFSILDSDGQRLSERHNIVQILRKTFPQLKSIPLKIERGMSANETDLSRSARFDLHAYLSRCTTLFDTAQYAGLAAVGVRMPIESLRKIYVPTSASVEQQQSAIDATERAIDELVETLGLDEHQRDQLARQMKAKYGSRKTSEVGEASRLYHNFSNLVVLGDPGSGKSCFVRSEILRYCAAQEDQDADWYKGHVPVFLPLVEYVYTEDNPKSLVDQCIEHAQGQHLSFDRGQINILLSRGKVAFFFDGLDEVRSIADRQRVLDDLTELVERYAVTGNRFVLTSRPAAIRDIVLPEELARVSLLGLTDQEIELLVNRLFEARHDDGGPLSPRERAIVVDILHDCGKTPGIRRLARNPLLLTLLAFVYENSGAFAARRHLIYSQAVKTLVSVRHRKHRSTVLSESDLRIRLGRLATAMFCRETSALPSRRQVASILQDVIDVSAGSRGDFVQQVAEETGLLLIHPRTIQKANDLISFMHHSFLEYYAAIGFLNRHELIDNAPDFVLNQRWREVVTLMFGILGEQGDITSYIQNLCKGDSKSEQITVTRLMLALDCALECDVPPVATQQFLAQQVRTVLTDGSGRVVSDVRNELGQRLLSLLDATGSEYVRQMILDGIEQDEIEVAAAFVELASIIQSYCNQDHEVLQQITKAFSRNRRPLNIAVINAMRSLPALRTNENLITLKGVIAGGGIVEKTAALQLLDEQPSLVSGFRDELTNLLYGSNPVLASGAASCIIHGGMFQLPDSVDFGMFDKALEEVISSDAPRRSLLGSVELSWQTLEGWIFSFRPELRARGFRSMAVVEAKTAKAHDLLFGCLESETEHSVQTVILDVLSTYRGAVEVASLAETDFICELTRCPYRDVREAAARVLRGFPTIQVVTRSLIEQYRKRGTRFTDETRQVIRSIAKHGLRDESCKALLQNELNRLINRQSIKWSQENVSRLSEFLLANDQVGMKAHHHSATRLLDLVKSFRSPPVIRRLSMQLYGHICPTEEKSVRSIVGEFKAPQRSRRLSAYRAARKLLQRCRSRFQTMQSVREALESMKSELLDRWEREIGSTRERSDDPALREIRNLLVEIEDTLGLYQEFSDRMTATSGGQKVGTDPSS